MKAVLTHHEVPQRKYTSVYFVPTDTKSMPQDLLIMSDHVRFAGQPVAAVAATTADIADQALELIEVEYEELPRVFDPEEAMQPGAPQLHDGAENNIAVAPVMEFGDIEAGFAAADHIFEGTYTTQRCPHLLPGAARLRGRVRRHGRLHHQLVDAAPVRAAREAGLRAGDPGRARSA